VSGEEDVETWTKTRPIFTRQRWAVQEGMEGWRSGVVGGEGGGNADKSFGKSVTGEWADILPIYRTTCSFLHPMLTSRSWDACNNVTIKLDQQPRRPQPGSSQQMWPVSELCTPCRVLADPTVTRARSLGSSTAAQSSAWRAPHSSLASS